MKGLYRKLGQRGLLTLLLLLSKKDIGSRPTRCWIL